MSRIHSTVIAMLFVIVSVSLVRADNPNPLVFNMYVTPTISGYSMSCDNQKHERKYDVSGTAEITYDSSYTAYTPEHYKFEVRATYNWVSCYYQEHVVLTAGAQELNYEAHRTLPHDEMLHLDPVLFYPGYFSGSGTLLDHKPDSGVTIEKIFLLSPSGAILGVLKWKNLTPDDAILPALAHDPNEVPPICERLAAKVKHAAKLLNFTNAQNQNFTKGDKILFVAQQYIPDDFFVDDWENIYNDDGAITNRPLFYYGTKANLTFTFLGEDHDTWSHIGSVTEVDMHGNALFYSLDTTDLTPGPWKVTAQITEMGSSQALDYPESDPLYFTVVQKLNLWDGFDLSSISLSPSIDYRSFTYQVPMSNGQFVLQYDPLPTPVVGPTFQKTYPLALDVYDGTNNLKFAIPQPEKAADVYLGFALPGSPGEIFLLYADKTLHPLAEGLKPWKENVSQAVDEVIFSGDVMSALPKGLTLDVYILITPHQDLRNYYFWKTYITTPR